MRLSRCTYRVAEKIKPLTFRSRSSADAPLQQARAYFLCNWWRLSSRLKLKERAPRRVNRWSIRLVRLRAYVRACTSSINAIREYIDTRNILHRAGILIRKKRLSRISREFCCLIYTHTELALISRAPFIEISYSYINTSTAIFSSRPLVN